MRPLPRSLDPLPGESLPGYVLRLAHRLDLAPSDVARRTGLLPAASQRLVRLSYQLFINPAPDTLADFAASTRLSHEEVAALTLTDLRDHYPPLALSLQQPRGAGHLRLDHWLFTGFPRYCPKCLAGDGSIIQQAHGGPWKKEWHLAVVFACLEHECFLKHQCPTCRLPDNRAAGGPLLIRPGARRLHPAQCRFPGPDSGRGTQGKACGTRLDHTETLIRPSRKLLDLQRDILGELDPALPGTLTTESLTDLRMVMGFIAASWPRSRYLLDADLVDSVNAYFQASKKFPADRHYRVSLMNTAPADAVVCGALIGVADSLLFAANSRQRIMSLFEVSFDTHDSRMSWFRFYDRHKNTCSQQLREILKPLVNATPATADRFVPRGPGFAPHHVPAFLEQDWHERFIRPTRIPLDERLVRRCAAIQLVRRAAYCDTREAALLLGIPADKVPRGIDDDRLWIGAKDAPTDFRIAVTELGLHLGENIDRLPDYQRRRDVLRDWVIPQSDWLEVTAHLPRPIGKQPVLDDRKRQIASIFIWTRVTGGEHLFAPRPLEQTQPQHIQRAWAARRPTTWHQLVGRPDPGPHYATLRHLLGEYAEDLIKRVDAGALPPIE
ncbi:MULTISPECIES: TniQ family protein [unclassified Streptomyces]|uniref:TniQ family protein n=1 Tax=unclassified Streptomyces TaxID=2593676 RepID=UPI001F040678|nr:MULTISPECIES: TniQ family protein [unclassified Streptomyces]MCH0565585.1 TniQ family protein [Streptomyces sp. MUM 2J]MCH0572108.1 TniQ family protein [Streptomyces sp. MUM 136J]